MRNISTRLLIACAAIGVAGGVLFTAHAWIGGLTVNTIPFLYGITMGLYFLPGALAQALFHRGGVALLTASLSGLVASPFQPIGFLAFLIGIVIGLIQELPFLIARYRVWKTWLFLVSGLVSGLLTMGAAFGILGGQNYNLGGTILVVASFFISPVIFTGIALWLARALDQAGVARGLRADERRGDGRQVDD
ncbi:ECF transporter S component [Gulosibacter molinativorax]|uniref:Acyl esterase n=1 Tax=Gulosibacter molinativorax TaxID=256821 RepID=A0ABT7C818_9MICO|nr:ECF transporter S component [Gulosibacter molinativorax]MDJ1371366.1 acyl esterase [Gulosibacter molinativorax]QUY62863.1 ABC-type transporter, permease protein [Gulosibacter molinativorax]